MNKIVILLDNGHGITSVNGSPDNRIKEYKFARDAVSKIHSILKAKGYDVRILVPEDADIRLGERCNRANAICAQYGKNKVMLVSVHLNAAKGSGWQNASGWEAWTSPGQTNGDKIADCLYDAAVKYLPTGTKIRTDMTDGDRDKEAKFTILKESHCPACLTENLFQNNKEDVDYLLTEEGMNAIVNLHVEGIENYIRNCV